MKVRRFSMPLEYFLAGVLALAGVWPAQTLALHHQTQTLAWRRHDPTPDQKNQPGTFVKPVRESTERFRDVSQPN
jgi:hypothetical protein